MYLYSSTSLHPETVDMQRLKSKPLDDPGGPDERVNWMDDAFKDHPCYGLLGIDPRPYASIDVGKEGTERLIDFFSDWLKAKTDSPERNES